MIKKIKLQSPRTAQTIHSVLAIAVIVVAAATGVRLLRPSHAETNSFVNVAASQVGVTESPLGSNAGPVVNIYTDNNPQAWCADFFSWVYKQAGHPFTGGASGGWRLASVQSVEDWFQKHAQWFSRTSTYVPVPGDFIHFNSNLCDCASGNHAAMVDHVEGTTLFTIEGNSSDKVTRRTYYNYKSYTRLIGFGHLPLAPTQPPPVTTTPASVTTTPPPVTASPPSPTVVNPYLCPAHPTLQYGSSGVCVQALQWALGHLNVSPGSYGLGTGGSFGPLTKSAVQKFQTSVGLYANGVVGAKTWEALGQHASIAYTQMIPGNSTTPYSFYDYKNNLTAQWSKILT